MHGTSSRVFTFKLIEEVDLWLLHMQMDAKLKHDTEVHITEVSKHGSKHLAALAGLQTLTIVGGNTIGAEGCKHLAALAGLQTLTIESNNEIGAEGCKYLAALTWLRLSPSSAKTRLARRAASTSPLSPGSRLSP